MLIKSSIGKISSSHSDLKIKKCTCFHIFSSFPKCGYIQNREVYVAWGSLMLKYFLQLINKG